MKARKFDITSAFGEIVSKSDTSPRSGEQIEYIDIDLIDDDPKNFYSLDGLEDLAANIQFCGLQQPVRVRPGEVGRVVIVSGHRRRAALKLLVNDGLEEYRAVPCIREEKERSEAFRELQLILANSSTRVLSSAEISKQAEKVEMLLYQLKEEGVAFPGRMRDQVAAACRVSAPKLARLKVIRDRLIPAYKQLFDGERLPEQTAYAIARLPQDFQERMSAALPQPPSGHTAEAILKKYEEGWRWEPEMKCPDGSTCRRGDSFLRHDVGCGTWEMCGGETCCLSCQRAEAQYGVCDRACSKAKARRKEDRDARQTESEKLCLEQQRKTRKKVQARAQRLLRAVDAAGLPDTARIQTGIYSGDSLSIARIRAYAAGEFGDAPIYESTLDPNRFDKLAETAKKLQCSTDYLLGVSDDLLPQAAASVAVQEPDQTPSELVLSPASPAAAPCGQLPEPEEDPWSYADPQADGLYWCVTGPLHGGGKLLYWAEDHWEHPAAEWRSNAHVLCWTKCPEIPEAHSWVRQSFADQAEGESAHD